jgi:acyl-coenzyme A synthetase/AMP-(fatty) acid ligase
MKPRIVLRASTGLGAVPAWSAERYGRVPIWLDQELDIEPRLGRSLDFVAFAEVVANVSGWLHEAGVRPGDVVAVLKRDNFDNVAFALGAFRLGAVPAMLSGSLDVDEAPILLSRLGNPVLLTDTDTATRGALRNVALRTVSRRAVVVGDPIAGTVSLDQLRGATPPPPTRRVPDGPGLVVHTSGTTGVPKLVQHSCESLVASARIGTRCVLKREDRVAVCISWVHIRAITGIAAPLVSGAALAALCRPSPVNALKALGRVTPTVVEAHPNILLRWEELLAGDDSPFTQVRMLVTTADAIHPRTVHKFLAASHRRFPILVEVYGMSETGPATVRIHMRHSSRRRNQGRSIPPLTRVRVVDVRTGKRVPAGEPGIVELATRSMFTTYVGENERARGARRGKWFRTADVGVLTRLGTLRVLDRLSDRVHGTRSCIAMEDLLLGRLDELAEVVLVGDADGGLVPVVATRTGKAVDARRWAAAIHDLPALKPPVHVSLDRLPMTATQKVRRFMLRTELSREGEVAAVAADNE